jgi:hypothetical protein
MLQLVYLSSATGPQEAALPALCEQASIKNQQDEITGVLMLRDGEFLQVLEGPREAVENTFLRIIVDARHHDLQLLSRKMITSRQFGSWSMAKCDQWFEQEAMIDRVREIISGAAEHLKATFELQFPTR